MKIEVFCSDEVEYPRYHKKIIHKMSEGYVCIYLWGVWVLELESYTDHNKGSDHSPCSFPKTHPIDPIHTAQQTNNPLIAQPLSGTPNCKQ